MRLGIFGLRPPCLTIPSFFLKLAGVWVHIGHLSRYLQSSVPTSHSLYAEFPIRVIDLLRQVFIQILASIITYSSFHVLVLHLCMTRSNPTYCFLLALTSRPRVDLLRPCRLQYVNRSVTMYVCRYVTCTILLTPDGSILTG